MAENAVPVYLRAMNLDFRLGDATRPRGHALAFFETSDGQILATYLVIAPITIDLAKYIPPMFSAQMSAFATQEITAMPLPPMPEPFAAGVRELERLARFRDDDLIFCGPIDPRQMERLLMVASEAGQSYVALYKNWQSRAPDAEVSHPTSSALEVGDVMLSLMSEYDRITELARMISKLRYAVETNDPTMTQDTLAEMRQVGEHLAAKYRITELIDTASGKGVTASRLAELYLERCFKLAAEEYGEIPGIEAEINRLSSS